MDNYFSLLDIEPVVNIDLEKLSDHHKKLAAQHHPDSPESSGDDTQYKLINTAYKALKSPAKRLTHLMEIAGVAYDKRGTVSDHLLDLFMSTAQLLQDADAFLRQQLQEQLGKQIEIIDNEQADTLEQATEKGQNNLSLENSARDLAFLEKWQAQLKERYASLF